MRKVVDTNYLNSPKLSSKEIAGPSRNPSLGLTWSMVF